jgi:hypothetical protein
MPDFEELPEDVGTYVGPEATALAVMHLVREVRTQNRLLYALTDQITALAPYLTPMGAPVDPSIRIREYLSDGDLERIENVSTRESAGKDG